MNWLDMLIGGGTMTTVIGLYRFFVWVKKGAVKDAQEVDEKIEAALAKHKSECNGLVEIRTTLGAHGRELGDIKKWLERIENKIT